MGYAPAALGRVLPRRRTPALVVNMVVGMIALLTAIALALSLLCLVAVAYSVVRA
jgi:hypothetical protein